MKKILSLTLCLAFAIASMAQTVNLKFTGTDYQHDFVKLDSIIVTNLTRGWQEVLYYPDTTLTLTNNVGIVDNEHSAAIAQNMPNPFDGTTTVGLFLSHPEKVQLTVVDVTGKTFCQQHHKLDKGNHNFRITLSTPQTYLLHITVGKEQHTIKMINEGHAGNNSITYMGTDAAKGPSLQSSHPFVFGDFMEYVGFTTFNDEVSESARINIQQGSSQTHTLVFPISTVWDGTGLNPNDGNPCDTGATDYDGNTYTTLQLGTQCWLQQNLRTTHFSDGTPITITSNSFSESTPYCYCPNNDSAYVHGYGAYGYLYNWASVLHGANPTNATSSGLQGPCPNGWHIPSQAEWTILLNYVGNQQIYQCNSNNMSVAKALASTTGWQNSVSACNVGNDQEKNNRSGFCAYPARYADNQTICPVGYSAIFWSCTQTSYVFSYYFALKYNESTPVINTDHNHAYAYSIRCLKN